MPDFSIALRHRCASAILPLVAPAILLAACAAPGASMAQALPQGATQADTGAAAPTYADLVDMARASQVVMRVVVADQAEVRAERAPGLAAGQARLYLETETQALLKAPGAMGESQVFLVDRPLTERGKAPKLKKQSFLIFANLVPGRPGELALAGAQAMQPADPALELRLREVLTQLAQTPAEPLPTGIRDIISVPGNLAGESETQMFVETAGGTPVSLSVIRRPGMAPVWGVSWSEIVDQSASAPQPGTVEWYRLACFLPAELPRAAFLQDDSASRSRATEDYRFVQQSLGPCERRLTG